MEDQRRRREQQRSAAPSSVPQQHEKTDKKSTMDNNLNLNNLWAIAEKNLSQKQTNESIQQKRVFVFVGDKDSGKTNLILKQLDIQLNQNSKIQQTVAISYKFATTQYEDIQTRVNTYELGGGRMLQNLLKAPLAASNIEDVATICITVDLSKPGNTYESLQFWLKAVREQIKSSMQDLQNSNIESFRVVKDKFQKQWDHMNVESAKINPMMIPITVIGTKYDIFAKTLEPVQRKVLCQALRYLCHVNGCDLVFSSIKEAKPLKLFKRVCNWHTFKNMAGGPKDEKMVDMDAQHPIAISAGEDELIAIGEPHGANQRQNLTIEQLWGEAMTKLPSVAENHTGEGLTKMAEFMEEKVDKMRIQKDQELEDYKREIERAKKFEKSNLLKQLQPDKQRRQK